MEETSFLPLLKVFMYGTATTELAWQGFPLNAGSQDKDDRFENLSSGHRFAPTARLALIFFVSRSLPLGD